MRSKSVEEEDGSIMRNSNGKVAEKRRIRTRRVKIAAF
jgi:hypothetical protein